MSRTGPATRQEQWTQIQEQRLARFVNRDGEVRSFCRMLDEPKWPRPVMFVWGNGGMGKSALLLRMMHECSLRGYAKAELIWTETRNHDYLAVMRKMRDDIGAQSFGKFTQLVNYFTDPQTSSRVQLVVDVKGQISVGENAAVDGQIGTLAGVAIRDLMLVVPRTDLGIPENERMTRLTDQFIQDLDEVSRRGKVVVFLDAIEKATEATQRWIYVELIGALGDGRLSNVNVVIGGRNAPMIDEDRRALIEARELGPLKREHIIEYLIKRNIDSGEASRVADWILAFSDGSPLKVANAVEAVARMRERDGMQ
jgi:hypothetical protein